MPVLFSLCGFVNELLSVVEISKVQDDEVGDGTTSVTVLACELLRVSTCIFYFKSTNFVCVLIIRIPSAVTEQCIEWC